MYKKLTAVGIMRDASRSEREQVAYEWECTYYLSLCDSGRWTFLRQLIDGRTRRLFTFFITIDIWLQLLISS